MIKFIDTDDIGDLEELEDAIFKNLEIAESMRSEISVLEKYSFKEELVNPDITNVLYENKEKETNDDENLYYYEEIKNASDDIDSAELENIIRSNFPSLNNKNYNSIIFYMKFQIQKEIQEYRDMMNFSTTTKEEAEDYLKCIAFDELKYQLIEKIEHEEYQETILDTKEKNKIVFFETTSGKNSPVNELKSIDHEFYESFLDLFRSIEDGTFRDAKRFSGSHHILKGTREVRNRPLKTRIVFDRLDKNTYIIISMFVKKTNLDSIYVNPLAEKVGRYKNQKDEIQNQLKNDPSYLEKQSMFYDEFIGYFNEVTKKR